MPDVGILNLQIHDDSAKAAEGLSKLVAKLGEMKEAASKIRLGTVATGIKRINDELNKVQPSAIYKLKQLADALDRIGSISGNVGGIRISFGGRGQNAEDIAAQLQAARDAVAQTTTGFEQIGQHIQEDVHGAETFAGAMGRVNEIVQQTGWTAQTTAEQFAQMFQAMNSMRMSRSLDAGTNPFALGDGTGGSGADWTYWKDGAIEVEGTVTDAMEAMTRAIADNLGIMDSYLEHGTTPAEMEIFTSLEEAARYYGITIDEVREKLINLAEGTVTVGVGEQVFASLEEAAQSMGISVEEAKRRIYDFASGVTEQTQTVNGTIDALDRLKQRYMDMSYGNLFGSMFRGERGERDQSAAIRIAAEKAGTSIDNIRAKMREWDTEMRGTSSIQNQLENMSVPTGIADEISSTAEAGSTAISVFGRLSSVMHSFGRTMSRLPEMFQNLKSGIKSMFPTITGLLGRFKGIMKYRALRAVLRHITDGFKTGYENYKQYSDAIGSDFASGIANANAQLLTMKNSIGAAIAPAIQAALPILQTLTNWAITAFNAVNQLLSLLTGKSTWSKAVAASADYLNDVKKAAGGAGSAVKDLLADWDELNIIQSESGGGGGGGGAGDAEDYLSMFEEVSTFDENIKGIANFINDNMDQIKNAAIDIGAILLGWKFSNAFGGLLGTLGTIMALGATMDLTWRVTEMVDNEYIKTGEDGWLISDILTNATGATIAGYLGSRIAGGAGGLFFAGFDLLISGAISFGIGYANKDSDEGQVVQKVGLIKGLIGEALIGAGFYIGTGSIAKGFYGAGLMAPMFIAVAGITMMVETSKKEYEIAEEFFRNSGKGGISVEKLFEDLNTEFNRLAEPYRLSTEAFASSQEATGRINEAFRSLAGLNDLITSGKMLTPEQAQQFKEAWNTVFTSFDEWSDANWTTIFEGFNAALTTENEELKKQARDAEITTLRIKEGLSEVEATLRIRMNELMDKVMKGEELSPEEQDEYEKKMRAFMILADESLLNFKDIIATAETVDFSDAEHPFDAAKQFVADASASYSEVASSIDEGLASQIAAIEERKKEIRKLVLAGILDEGVAKTWTENLDSQIELFTRIATANKDKAFNDLKDSFVLILNTAKQGLEQYINEDGTFDFSGAETFVQSGLFPILDAMRDAGLSIDDMKGIFERSGFDLYEALMGIYTFRGDDEDALVDFILREIGDVWERTGKELNLDDRFIQRMFDLDEWDTGIEYQHEILERLIDVFGFDTVAEALKNYYELDLAEIFKIRDYNDDVFGGLRDGMIRGIKDIVGDASVVYQEQQGSVTLATEFSTKVAKAESSMAGIQNILEEIGKTELEPDIIPVEFELESGKTELEPVIIPVEFELESGIDMSSLLKDFEFDLKLSSINVPDEEDYNGYIFGRAFAKSTDLLMNNTGSYNYPDGSASNTVNNGSNVEEDVNRGTAQGFGTLSAQLATANALLTALLNKQFVATVAPTAGTGHGLQTAINAFNNLTGNGV